MVCMIGFTSPEYLFSLQGSWLIGCVAAGIYTTNSAAACHYVLEHSEAKICLCQGGANAAKIASLRESLPNLKAIVVFWPDDGVPEVDSTDGFAGVYTWNDFLQLGKSIQPDLVQQRIETVRPGNCASLIYTSGTTVCEILSIAAMGSFLGQSEGRNDFSRQCHVHRQDVQDTFSPE